MDPPSLAGWSVIWFKPKLVTPSARRSETKRSPVSHSTAATFTSESNSVLPRQRRGSVLAQQLQAVLALELGHPLRVHEVVVVCARRLRAPFGELLRRAARSQFAELSISRAGSGPAFQAASESG